MKAFKNKMLQTKKISVWGIGYLGYTTVLKLQARGFFTTIFDFSSQRIEELNKGLYPNSAQKSSWTKRAEIPRIDFSTIVATTNYEDLFENCIHIISIPSTRRSGDDYEKLMKIFLDHEDKFENSLIIFQSAGIPGTIDRFLSKLLVKQNLLIATAFRDDWEIDDFLSSKRKRMVTCNNQNAKIALELFFEFFHIDIYFLNSIKEAEILANASLSITSIINGFLNELCFAYPNTNLKDFSKMILENLPLDEISLSIGLSRYKLANASNNLIEGSKKEDGLSILKISNSFNLSLILYYGDLIAKKGCKKVAIYGVSGEGDLKEIRVSASVILAEYLKNLGLEVYLNDPLFDNSELESILPFTKIFNLVDKADVECVIFMAPHNEYKYLTQKDLKEMGILNCEIIIDNTEFFKDYIFDEKTIYHIAGDGKLSELEL